jgi:hypothetical protein
LIDRERADVKREESKGGRKGTRRRVAEERVAVGVVRRGEGGRTERKVREEDGVQVDL